MTRAEIEVFLEQNLALPENLRKEVVHFLMEAYIDEPGIQTWEQLRFIKQKMDFLWKTIKVCSEKRLVREKLDQMIKSFPRPADVLKRRPKKP